MIYATEEYGAARRFRTCVRAASWENEVPGKWRLRRQIPGLRQLIRQDRMEALAIMMPDLSHTIAWYAPRFHAAVQIDPSGCHLWTRSKNSRGYGAFYFDGKVHLAHRVAWVIAHGSWPDPALRVDHICEVKACVNPAHLRELTNRENILRSPRSPMNVLLAATECRNGHPYDATTRIDANGWRVCSRCPSRRGRSS